MKESIKLFCITLIILFIASNSFSTPLNGTYTIGSGGNYPTINSAFSDAVALGINGPVIFDIITGTYNEEVVISFIPGSTSINTVTLKSQSGNAVDVLINGVTNVINIISADIIVSKLTFGTSTSNSIGMIGNNLKLTDNNFNNVSITSGGGILDILISGNENIGNMHFEGQDFGPYFTNINIINNRINGSLLFVYCFNILIEKNVIGGTVVLCLF